MESSWQLVCEWIEKGLTVADAQNEAVDLSSQLANLPAAPGVYVFWAAHRKALYIGKARSLKQRVRSYFQASSTDQRAFIAHLGNELDRLETIVVSNEKEAALLENQLIKELRPRYNIKLRDDKEYLSLRLDPSEPWPRLRPVRKPRDDGARYFGPYPSATVARQTLKVVNRHFRLRTCSDREFASRKRPCLQYQIKRCPAPCVLPIDKPQYDEQIQAVSLFLAGRYHQLEQQLQARMRQAALQQRYEEAAQHRDQLKAVEAAHQHQTVALEKPVDYDVVGYFRQGTLVQITLLWVRSGKVVAVRHYDLDDVYAPDDAVIADFLRETYAQYTEGPQEILLPRAIEAMDGLGVLLSRRTLPSGGLDSPAGRRVKITAPRRGPKAELLRLAMENAAHAFAEKARAQAQRQGEIAAIARLLRLRQLPKRIECIDISHMAGESAAAAIVALDSGDYDRQRYRHFRLKTAVGGDDYGAMREVLSRRFSRALSQPQRWSLPQLLVVDGGPSQLRMALDAARDCRVEEQTGQSLDIVALAKERDLLSGRHVVERLYLPGQKNPVAVDSHPALRLLQKARDEAHRAANALRTQGQRKVRRGSALESVPGLGPKSARKLLKHFGSLQAVLRATPQELHALGLRQAQIAALSQGTRGS